MAAAWNEEQFRHFQPAEKYSAEMTVVMQCVRQLDQLMKDYRQKRWQRVVEIYEGNREHFDSCSDYLTGFKPHVEEAFRQTTMLFQRQITTALDENDDQALEKILSERGQGFSSVALLDYFTRLGALSAEDRERAGLALERLAVIREIKTYLARVDAQDRAVELFDEKEQVLRLTDSQALSRTDRSALYDARRALARDTLRQAVTLNDDDKILVAAGAALAVGWALPDSTLDRVRQAAERQAARARLAQADNVRDRIIAYDDELLAHDRHLAQGTRQEIESTRSVFKWLLAARRAIRRNDVRAIAVLVSDPAQAHELALHLEPSEKLVLERVQAAVQTLHPLREAIAIRPRTMAALQQIVDLCAPAEMMQTLEQLLSPFEKKQVRNALDTYTAIDELNRLTQAPDMAFIKLAIARTYQTAQAAGVVLPGDLNWTRIRTALRFHEEWSMLVAAIHSGDEHAIFQAWNPTTLNEGLELLDERDRLVLVKALQNTTRSARIASALASQDAERIAYVQRELDALNS